MKVKVFIVDGIVEDVLMDAEAMAANTELEIVNYDKDNGQDLLLTKEYNNSQMQPAPYSVEHCDGAGKDIFCPILNE